MLQNLLQYMRLCNENLCPYRQNSSIIFLRCWPHVIVLASFEIVRHAYVLEDVRNSALIVPRASLFGGCNYSLVNMDTPHLRILDRK